MSKDADSIVFWLEYWLASYKHLLQKNRDFLNFLNYEVLCKNPEQSLKLLAETVNSGNPNAIRALATRIRYPKPKEVDTSAVPSSLLREVNLVYTQLKEESLN